MKEQGTEKRKLYRVPGTVKRERRSAGGGGDI
jgi:hypothetical protein